MMSIIYIHTDTCNIHFCSGLYAMASLETLRVRVWTSEERCNTSAFSIILSMVASASGKDVENLRMGETLRFISSDTRGESEPTWMESSFKLATVSLCPLPDLSRTIVLNRFITSKTFRTLCRRFTFPPPGPDMSSSVTASTSFSASSTSFKAAPTTLDAST